VIAVDTNILVYAHRRDSTFHQRAAEVIRGLAEGTRPWAIPWPCIHEFLAIVTHPRIFKVPSPIEIALAQVTAWRGSAVLRLLPEAEGYWDAFARIVGTTRVTGPKIHDARIAALSHLHGVTELLSADRDFSRFAELRVRNPL
jgi:toxin-antitoxin system PIN domain toxin